LTRRHALTTLLAAPLQAHRTLDSFFDRTPGAAVLINASSGIPIAEHDPDRVQRAFFPPGSTLKPFVLATLIETGKLRPSDRWRCPGDLQIAGRALSCSHPPLSAPLDARAALAYSCNNFVAHFAERLGPEELTLALARYGIESDLHSDIRLIALGEGGVLTTVSGLAAAYRRLALRLPRPVLAPVLAGLEDAVDYGTGQRAKAASWKVAGKTGSVVSAEGAHVAWFAGFAPSRGPKFIAAVMVQGRSGGADAAPIAGRILEACAGGTL
jgi:cell division protein FtsI/penicillin-binding protein 2